MEGSAYPEENELHTVFKQNKITHTTHTALVETSFLISTLAGILFPLIRFKEVLVSSLEGIRKTWFSFIGGAMAVVSGLLNGIAVISSRYLTVSKTSFPTSKIAFF